MNEPRPFARSPAALAATAALLALLVSEAVFSRLVGEPSQVGQFIGRFHPLAVHLPIGVILLVAAGEALSFWPRFRARVDPAIGLALAALLASVLGAFFLGQLLGRSGDFAPRVLKLHRRLELFAAVGVCACFAAWAFHARSGSARSRLAYRLLLGFTLLVMSAGAHFGGTMTRGETYLSRYAPGPLKPLLGGGEESERPKQAEAPRPEPTLFAAAVAPILNERCVGCHGPDKSKGGLRLDSFDGVMKGGEQGPVVTPGSLPDSRLLALILLPVDDDAHMPPQEKPQPTPAEVAVLRFWIERGANDKVLLRDAVPPAEARALLEKALTSAPKAVPASSAAPTPTAAPPAGSNTASSTFTGPAPSTPPGIAPAPATPAAPAGPTSPGPGSPAPAVPDPEPEAAPVVPEAAGAARSARSILASACEACHGAKKQKGKLRVDSLEALLAGGKGGPAVIPGKPGESALIRRIQLPLSDDEHMPPGNRPQLRPAEIQTLSAWVRGLASSDQRVAAPAQPPAAGGARARTAAPSASAPEEPTPPASDEAPPPAASAANEAEAQPAATPPAREASAEQLAALPARIVLYPDAVAPLLLERCGNCHSGDKPAMGLRVDSHAALMKGGLSGPAVIPGKPDESLLLQRVLLPLDDGDHMPPDDEPQLTSGEVALLRTFIRHGATLGFEATTSELAADVRNSIALRPPKTWSSPVEEPVASKAGGCAACAVGSPRAAAPGSWSWAALLSLALVLRRSCA
jgi:mono/diheme cytochrome c family protein/uncharacterized membrane protein